MEDSFQKILQFANDHPFRFIALITFGILGGVPLVVFLVYAGVTIIASIVGVVVLELVLLGVGITGLAFVLFFVTCITTCTTASFVTVYYSCQVARSTWKHTGGRAFRQSGLWQRPRSSSHLPASDHDETSIDAPLDKTK